MFKRCVFFRKNSTFNRLLPGLLAFALLYLTGGCSKDEERRYPDIELPPTPVLTLETNWGLITSPLLRLREKPDQDSPAVTTLWQGSVMEILSQTSVLEEVEGKSSYWYRVSYDGFQGWLFGGYIRIYGSRNEAERASRELRS